MNNEDVIEFLEDGISEYKEGNTQEPFCIFLSQEIYGKICYYFNNNTVLKYKNILIFVNDKYDFGIK